MTNTMRYEVASFTKNPVALATMKLLRMHGLTHRVPDRARGCPPSWKRGTGFETMKFRHLLAHTSGINQMLAAKKAELGETTFDSLFNNSWDGLQEIVAQTVTLDSARSYKNANYGILGHPQRQPVAGARAAYDPPSRAAAPPRSTRAPTRSTPSSSCRRTSRRPAGINLGPASATRATDGLNYPAGATQNTKGSLGAWPALNCAGNAGLRLSATEMVRYLAHLRHGTIVHPDDLKTMDKLRLGWSGGRAPPAAHGGARWQTAPSTAPPRSGPAA